MFVLSVLMLFSLVICGSASAANNIITDNITMDSLNATSNGTGNVSGQGFTASAIENRVITEPTISGTVCDAYDNSTGNYVSAYDYAVPVANATVNLRGQNNNQMVGTTVTDSSGSYVFNNLAKGDYTVEILYRTYKNFVKNVTLDTTSLTVDHTFVPDIAIISNYGTASVGQLNKMQALENLSSRVYTISSSSGDHPADKYKQWMLAYANFILVDMYSDAFAVSVNEIANSPANKNRMIAYVFGIYNAATLKTLSSWNFLGGTDGNNTPNSLENTYIGSYWQAQTVKDNSTVQENMQNMLNYIFYLMGETSVNPTEIANETPVLAGATWGIYHPDYGVFGIAPTQKEINNWIREDPGYNNDGSGSLNWMTNKLIPWQAEHNTPSQIFKDFENWYTSNKSITGSFIIIASYYAGGAVVDDMIRTYEAQGRAVFNLFQSYTDSPSMSDLLEELTVGVNGTGPLSRGVVCVTSLYDWSMYYSNMANGGAIDNFTAMNIAIIKAVYGISEYSYMSEYGPQAEWTYAVTIPEFEGVFGAVPVSYIDSSTKEEIPVQAGIDKIVELTNGWAKLKEKANADKKVAIILYDYPPGKSDIGASYLDVFQSLHDLLEEMCDEGYNIGMSKSDIPSAAKLYTLIAAFGNKGSWAQGLLNTYVEGNYTSLVANNQLVNLTQYMEWFNELPQKLQDELVAQWGSGLGSVMVYNNSYIVIPGMVCGNVFITVQPSRGWETLVTAEQYHSATLPPHQQYVAFYKWIDQVFGADAMIHLGTHGTLEWLPGRPIGLEADDWTFQLSTIPDIYPYITSDPGEGMVAKERAFALVISHMTPATVESALYGNYTLLQNYINNYQNALKVNATDLVEQYEIKIKDLAVNSLGLDAPKEGESFDDWVNSLDGYLEELQNDIITLGLHTLGQGLEGDDLIQETITIASSRTEIMNNIKNFLYHSLNVDYYSMINDPAYEGYVTDIKSLLTSWITELVNGTSLNDLAAQIGINNQTDIFSDLSFCVKTISELSTNTEMEAIMTALSGGYVVPGLAGDPSYCDSLPTGTSIYSVDTTKMPTEAAWESAKALVDKQLVEYYEEHGGFPDTVALVMWGTELLRTEGISMAEFLYYLGVEPVWSETGTGVVKGVKLMDLSDLTIKLDNGTVINRPRIDVFATAVTSNADWLKLMNKAVYLANAANESTNVNYVKKHYAENPSLDRIFGLEGAVLEGTGVSDFLPNTEKWDTNPDAIADMAQIYLSRISNAWTVDEDGNVVVSKDLSTFEYLLKHTSLVTQNIDSTWRFLDSNDYYDWFGGLVLASQYLGANPDTSVVDIRNKNDIITRTLSDELNFEVRSMLLNPTYQNALLSSESGWMEYAARYENLFAFNLIDKDTGTGSTGGTGTGTAGGSLISDTTWGMLASNLLSSAFDINADYKSTSFQSMAGWLLEAAYKGIWHGDSKTVTDLTNKYIQAINDYGVCCCHHTCANILFNQWLVQASSLSSGALQQYASTMAAATGQTINVPGGSSSQSNGQSGSQSSNGQSGSQSSSGGSQSSSSVTPGLVASAGQTQSSASGAQSGSTGSQSSSSGSAGSQSGSTGGSGSSNAHEITPVSSQNSSSSSGVSIGALLGVLLIIGLVGVGYFKGKGRN